MSKIKNICFLFDNLYNYLFFRIKRVKINWNNVILRGRIRIHGSGKLVIEDGVKINSSSMANQAAGTRTVFYILEDALLKIGKNTGISNSTFCCTKGISIGDNVTIGGDCIFYDTDFHSIYAEKRRERSDNNIISKEIDIKNDVFIGAKCIILKGVSVGERSVIGAGSVVTKSIPNDEVWAGNPAKFVKKLV